MKKASDMDNFKIDINQPHFELYIYLFFTADHVLLTSFKYLRTYFWFKFWED